MNSLAIDLGGTNSQLCLRAPDGKIVRERRVSTRGLEAVFARTQPTKVIVEACAEAFKIADLALEHGHQITVLPSTTVRALGVGARGIKTDKRDARLLSDVACKIDLPSIHVPKLQARERKSHIALRESLVQARTGLINSVRGWARTQLLKFPSGATSSFPERVRLTLEEHEDGLPLAIERVLVCIDELNEQIDHATKELEETAKQDPICQRLMTVPGVGPITSLCFAATLDEVERFPNAHAAESYLGLTPGENSSGERQRRTGITKAGSSRARYLLLQAAWSFWRSRPHDPAVLWAKDVELRRGRRIAITALARKLAGILFAIWRDGSTYEPARAAGPQRPAKTTT